MAARRNILIVSPNQLFREGLKHLLLKARFTVDGEGKTFAEMVKAAAPSKPVDLIILTLEPGSGIDAGLVQIRCIRRDLPSTKLVALAASLSSAEFRQVMHAGVDAILTDDISGGVLQASLELVLQSQQIFLAHLSHLRAEAAFNSNSKLAACEQDSKQHEKRGAEEVSNLIPFAPLHSTGCVASTPLSKARLVPAPTTSAESLHVPVLSERENQILHCLVKGFSNKAIARELEIAETTVKVHVKGLMRKVRAANRTQVAIWAMNQYAATEDTAAQGVDSEHEIGALPGIVVGLPDQPCSA